MNRFSLSFLLLACFVNVYRAVIDEAIQMTEAEIDNQVEESFYELITNQEIKNFIKRMVDTGTTFEPYIGSVVWNYEIEDFRNEQNKFYHLSNPADTPHPTIRLLHDRLRENHDQIKNEVQQLLLTGYKGFSISKIDAVQSSLADGRDQWTAIWVKYFQSYAGTARFLPTLTNIVHEIEDDVLQLYVSILWPGASLRPHIGTSMGVLRYHYGLEMPTSNDHYNMTFDETPMSASNITDHIQQTSLPPQNITQVYQWSEREGIIFDDTLSHAVCNFAPEPRIVILADVYRIFDHPFWTKLNKRVHQYAGKMEHMIDIQERFQKEGEGIVMG